VGCLRPLRHGDFGRAVLVGGGITAAPGMKACPAFRALHFEPYISSVHLPLAGSKRERRGALKAPALSLGSTGRRPKGLCV
jgi:hypothetical protein